MTEINSNPNLHKSIFARLKNKAKSDKEDINYILQRYGAERLLYRLSTSDYREQFVLKGGMLFLAWQGKSHRVTRDIDFLGYGSAKVADIEDIFRSLCNLDGYDDGLIFLSDTLTGTEIREDANYAGVRIILRAKLGNAHIKLQVDVGFGDVITPAKELIKFPTLLDMPSPEIQAYPKYTMIAEKFEVMVSMGIGNSRLKDFYDIWTMSHLFDFDGAVLQKATVATFKRRQSPFPAHIPFALTEGFYTDADKVKQWKAFIKRVNEQDKDLNFETVIQELISFLMPIIDAQDNQQVFSHDWSYEAQQWTAKPGLLA